MYKKLLIFQFNEGKLSSPDFETYDKATVNAECSMALPQSWNGET